MDTLTKTQMEHLAATLAARKERLLEEIRGALARTKNERYADLLAGGSDAGDQSIADLLSDVAQAEVGRDIHEMSDINAAQARAANGRYGVCIDCGAAIGYRRLQC